MNAKAFHRCMALAALVLVPGVFANGPSPVLDPDEGLPRLHWQDAHAGVGKTGFVYGKIVRVGSSRTMNFLNFSQERNGPFTVVIRKEYADAFPESLASMFEQKFVEVRGDISTYRGAPQIQVYRPEQIRVLDKLPELKRVSAKESWSGNGQLKIATFNVYNLFDGQDDPFHSDYGTRTKPRVELEKFTKVIREIDADVLALQEVESRGYLNRIVDIYLADMGYEHVVHYEGNDGRGIDVCLLSRVPVGTVTSHRHVRYPGPGNTVRTMERDLLHVMLHPDSSSAVEVMVLHLKSNFGGREHAEPIRLAEAKYVRSVIDGRLAQNPDAKLVVLGDYNDTWDSASTQAIAGKGSHALTSFFSEIAADKQVTYNKEPYRSMIDFILVSPAMAKDYRKGSFKIRGDSVEQIGSDHNAVMATFNLK